MEYILDFVGQYSSAAFPVAVIAPLIGGEAAVLALAFIAGQGVFPLAVIIIGGFIGMVLLDSFWFFFPRTPWGKKMKQKGRENFGHYRALEEKILKFSHENDIIILLISKILVGTRILILLYLSMRDISFRKFLFFNSVATSIWAVALGCAGWFAGLGYYSLSQASDDLRLAGLYFVGVIAIFYLVLFGIRKWITKK